jgi:hypothetical protein
MATKIRQQGTKDTKAESTDEKIAAIRSVVSTKQYAKIDGVMVDLYSASAICRVLDGLKKPETYTQYIAMPIAVMATIAFKILNSKE